MDQAIAMSVEEAARACGLSRSKLYLEIGRGDLPVVRIGKSIRVRAVDLDAWLERHLDPGPDATGRAAAGRAE